MLLSQSLRKNHQASIGFLHANESIDDYEQMALGVRHLSFRSVFF
jgi:hypothetical protein